MNHESQKMKWWKKSEKKSSGKTPNYLLNVLKRKIVGGRAHSAQMNQWPDGGARIVPKHWIWMETNLHIILKPLWCGRYLIFPPFIFFVLVLPFCSNDSTRIETLTHKPKLSSFIFNNYYFALLEFVANYFLFCSLSHSFPFDFAAQSTSRDAAATFIVGRIEKNTQNLRRNHNKTTFDIHTDREKRNHIECCQINRKKHFRFWFHSLICCLLMRSASRLLWNRSLKLWYQTFCTESGGNEMGRFMMKFDEFFFFDWWVTVGCIKTVYIPI